MIIKYKSSLVALGVLAALGSSNALASKTSHENNSTATVQANNQFIVTYKNNNQNSTVENSAFANKAKASVMQQLSTAGYKARYINRTGTGADVIQIKKSLDSTQQAQFIKQLKNNPNVEYVEPDVIMTIASQPNDTDYDKQWDFNEEAAGLNVESAWELATGSGVVVAVIDTGIAPHSDLDANIIDGYDFITDPSKAVDGDGRDSDPNDPGDWWANNECGELAPEKSDSSWHGTHVAGTVAAVTNNGYGVAGVAPNAKVQSLRVLGKCGGRTSDVVDAIIWASGGSIDGIPANPTPANVINMSLGAKASCDGVMQSAINTAVENGTVVVVAAGNSQDSGLKYRPGNCENVINVSSLGRGGNLAYYSNWGQAIDVTAPGGDKLEDDNGGIYSTLNSGTKNQSSESFGSYQGTSMASPHVAGVVALMQSRSEKTPSEVESILKSTAREVSGRCSSGCGDGLVDATEAVLAVGGPDIPPPGDGDNVLDKGVAVSGLEATTGNEIVYTMEVPEGATNLSFDISSGSGDADLYVQFNSQPTDSSYDCRPYKGGNNESCSFASPQAGTYYVRMKAYSSFSNLELIGDYELETTPPNDDSLQNGVSEALPYTGSGQEQLHTITVPAGTAQLTVSISGGSGDADMYIKQGSAPTDSNYDCRPYKYGNSESCQINNPSGTYHIRVKAYNSFSGVSLLAEY